MWSKEAVWVLPIIAVEIALVLYLSHVLLSKRKTIYNDQAHALKSCGTIYDKSPLREEDVEGLLGEDQVGEGEVYGASHVVSFSHKLLGLYRIIVFCWMIYVKFRAIKYLGLEVWVFFTTWNYVLQMFYFFFASTCSLLHVAQNHVPVFLLRITNLLHAICIPMCILVSIVYWCVLTPQAFIAGTQEEKDHAFDFLALNQHLINTITLMVEFGVNRYAVHDHHFVPILSWTYIYCIFVWIQHLFTNFWPYFFLKLDPIALMWYTLILVLHFGVFKLVGVLSDFKIKKTHVSNTVPLLD